MELLDGRAVATAIKTRLKEETETFVAAGRRRPKLVAVLAGDNAASAAYVRNKERACAQAGFDSEVIRLPQDVTEDELLATVRRLNADSRVDGFIVQLPLPRHIRAQRILMAIDPAKDVDGFHPANFGRMALGLDGFIPATPYGILLLLEHYQIQTAGLEAVVLGRSHIVGLPMSILLAQKRSTGNATVTLVHSRTADLKAHTRRADLLIAAIGRPGFVTGDMVKPGAIVIDVGINRVKAPERKSGYRLSGDVDFDSVRTRAAHLTPVPGGVGPMTVAGLLMNTMKAYKRTVQGPR